MTDDDWKQQINLEAYRVAKETRNLEINLFWQRSNYFLVLSGGIAAAFFSAKRFELGPLACSFGGRRRMFVDCS